MMIMIMIIKIIIMMIFGQARKMGALFLAFLSTNHIWRPRLQDSKVCGKICSFAAKEH